MSLDIRMPLGLLFCLIGALLVTFGAVHGPQSLVSGVNVNVDWGAILVIFGVSMLLLAKRHAGRLRRDARSNTAEHRG